MIKTRQLSRLIGDIYAVWEEEQALQHLINLLIQTTGANTGSIRLTNATTRNLIDSCSIGFAPKVDELYTQLHKDDLYRQLSEAQPEGCFTNVANYPHVVKKYLNSDYYDVLGKPYGIRHATGSHFRDTDNTVFHFNFQRPEGQKAFSDNEVTLLDTLLPHLKQSIFINKNIQQLQISKDGFKKTDAQKNNAVFLLDKNNHIVDINKRAEDFLNTGLCLTKERSLYFSNIKNQKLFSTLCEQSKTSVSSLLTLDQTGIVTKQLTLNQQSYYLRIEPWFYDCGFLGVREVGLLVTLKENKPPTIDSKILCELFSLTPTEAEISKLICLGKSNKQICDIRNCKESTVNFHMKSIYSKLEVNRNTELVNKILTSLAAN